MAVQKKINFQTCTCCGQSLGIMSFSPTKNHFYRSGYLPICNNCLVDQFQEELTKNGEKEQWNTADKFCQILDVPFVPARWIKLYEEQGAQAIIPYLKIFLETKYQTTDWKEYQEEYKDLQNQNLLSNVVIPGFNDQQLRELRVKWGPNYDDEEPPYLEQLYNGVLTTQSVNGALQTDQALKLCKLSLTIDSRIREGADIDKLLASYEKLVKVAEFTPKNVKNAQDFDSVGELFSYLEKTGFMNKFYDGVKRDIVDVTMNNIQNFCQRLYTQESGIGEDIEKRIESLKCAKDIEDNMGLLDDYTSDSMTQEIEEYFEQEDFNPEVNL